MRIAGEGNVGHILFSLKTIGVIEDQHFHRLYLLLIYLAQASFIIQVIEETIERFLDSLLILRLKSW